MKSIKGQFLLVLFGVVAVCVVVGIGIFTIQLRATEQYKSVTDTMIAEYQLVDTSSTLINAFNTYVKSAGTSGAESSDEIQQAETKIRNLTLYLDNTITDTESRSDYLGFKASIDTLQKQIDASVARFEEGNIQDYINDYADANKDYGFVRDNGTVLIFSQLKYTSAERDSINKTYLDSLYACLFALLLVILCCIGFVFWYADQFSKPLRALTLVSKQIAGGNMDFVIDQRLLSQSNEFGSLANSFASMTRTLKDKIAQLDASNLESKKNAEATLSKNSELGRLNRLMVDRELKMVELKKEIETLKGKK